MHHKSYFLAQFVLEKDIYTIEEKLISALKKGSREAFDDIYQIYSKRLYAYSLQFTKSHEESEEIVQEVFIKLWINRAHIKQEETLQPLLFIMAKHLLINAYRAKLNHPVYEEFINYKDELSVDNTHHQVEYDEFFMKFQKLLETLPMTQRKIIQLSRMHNLSNKEIASTLLLSEQTVKNQLSEGLKNLKEKLSKYILLLMLILVD